LDRLTRSGLSPLVVYVDPPDGIDQPDNLTYLSRTPLRRWSPGDDDTWPTQVLPAADLLQTCLDGALDRYRELGG
jgi:hypothetical protein